MAIVRMISRNLAEFREFQTRMIPFGRIRTGVFETPPGKRGRPAKLDRFRFTSPDRDVIGAVAAEYGGTVEAFTAQGVGKNGWQVTSDADRIPVYIVNGQRIEPCYEAWAAGGRKMRDCDGEWDRASAAPCVCNGLNPEQPRPAPKDMCKMTTRVNLMLPVIEGLGTWLYESHGENFAIENGGVLAAFVAGADVAVPAWFCLEPEVRQHRRDDGTFERREFYVARFRITAITPEQIALGGDVVSRILMEAGAPAALSGGPRQAIGAAPVPDPAPDLPGPQAPPQDAQGVPVRDEGAPVDDAERARILAAIEGAPTLARLDGIREGLARRNIKGMSIQDAWVSKRKAIVAQEGLRAEAEALAADPVDRAAIDEVRADLGMGPLTGPVEREYAVGDTVTVGGIEFTKISDNPFPPGSDAAALFGLPVEGDVEEGTGPGSGLPLLPDGDYDFAEQSSRIMTLAGQRTPPMTTDQVIAMIKAAFGLKLPSEATGLQLARMAEAMKRGIL